MNKTMNKTILVGVALLVVTAFLWPKEYETLTIHGYRHLAVHRGVCDLGNDLHLCGIPGSYYGCSRADADNPRHWTVHPPLNGRELL